MQYQKNKKKKKNSGTEPTQRKNTEIQNNYIQEIFHTLTQAH